MSDAVNPARRDAPEVWKRIPGREPYEVSNRGRVRNGKTGRVHKPETCWHGYLRVRIGPVRRMVHVLVLEALVGPRPPNHEARHVHDRNPANCDLWNLEWGTREANLEDRFAHGTLTRLPNLIGRVFGRLRVVSKDTIPSKNSRWVCVCECGGSYAARGDQLVSGKCTRCRACVLAASPQYCAKKLKA